HSSAPSPAPYPVAPSSLRPAVRLALRAHHSIGSAGCASGAWGACADDELVIGLRCRQLTAAFCAWGGSQMPGSSEPSPSTTVLGARLRAARQQWRLS